MTRDGPKNTHTTFEIGCNNTMTGTGGGFRACLHSDKNKGI